MWSTDQASNALISCCTSLACSAYPEAAQPQNLAEAASSISQPRETRWNGATLKLPIGFVFPTESQGLQEPQLGEGCRPSASTRSKLRCCRGKNCFFIKLLKVKVFKPHSQKHNKDLDENRADTNTNVSTHYATFCLVEQLNKLISRFFLHHFNRDKTSVNIIFKYFMKIFQSTLSFLGSLKCI